MANSHRVKSPDEPSGGVPSQDLLRVDNSSGSAQYFAYAQGTNTTTSPPVKFTGVRGKVFNNATDANNAVAAAAPDPDGVNGWKGGNYTGGFIYNFGGGAGQGTLPGAQVGTNNWLVVFAEFDGSAGTWVPASGVCPLNFNGVSFGSGPFCIPKAGFYIAAKSKKRKKPALRKKARATRKRSRGTRSTA